MNKLLDKLERKFGRYSVPHLSVVMIGCYIVGYLLMVLSSRSGAGIIDYMTLNPYLILHGQIWRLITWIVIPPSSLGIFTVIMLLFYLSIGSTLERTWGDFRYNVYIFGGMLISIISAFLTFALFCLILGSGNAAALGTYIGASYSTYYICMSIFLGFAATFPEAQVLLYFIIPVKVKWLGFIYAAFLVYEQIRNIRYIFSGYVTAWIPIIAAVASLLNFIIFFVSTRSSNRVHLSAKEKAMRKQFRENMKRVEKTAPDNITIAQHCCEICGRTNLTNPELEFRYCSKCEGAHEYCMDHLYTHVHVRNEIKEV